MTPTDTDLDQMIAATQQLPPGRIDIDRNEWLAVLELLRDTRAWVLAVRVGLEKP